MNSQQIDLNLLRVFGAVFEDRKLLRAGKRLHLSQSALSHALTRLRETLQDELFVRTAKGMEPTRRRDGASRRLAATAAAAAAAFHGPTFAGGAQNHAARGVAPSLWA